MRNIYTKKTKRIASALLIIWLMNIILPSSLYALTSGPSQPESQAFQPAGVSDMVDLSTGDFKYNIPLMDVDGYPLNLNYQSGVGIDDEASWVGLGWNLNVGSITRQLRGVPDDFAGDSLNTVHSTKPKITVGGRASVKFEFKGIATLGGSFNLGVFSDNYVGIGAEVGVNAGISLGNANSGSLTASMGLGILSSTASGVDVTPSLSIGIKEKTTEDYTARAGLSASLGYSSRSGMKSLTLGSSFSIFNTTLGNVSFNTEPIMPKIQVPRTTQYSSFSFDVGPALFGGYASFGGTGYRSINSVASESLVNREYGFLYAERGKDDKSAIMDFIREKDNPIINELPNLALPVHTPDVFSYTSQNGSGQFRLYRGGTGAFADNEAIDRSSVSTFGGDIGFGGYFHGGLSAFEQNSTTSTRKWQIENSYLKKADFQNASYTNPNREHVFFKQVGEKGMEDKFMSAKMKGTSPIAVKTVGRTAVEAFRDNSNFYQSSLSIDSAIDKTHRQVKTTAISYLTGAEAKLAGFNKKINTYNFKDYSGAATSPTLPGVPNQSVNRVDEVKKKHHISEMTVTGVGGERMVYGIPVYNIKQEEYSFAVGNKAVNDYQLIAGNQIGLNLNADQQSINHKKGVDYYYHKESLPAYATSFLLTELVSPDYQDVDGLGIGPDDQGTAIKFNYSRIDNYKWRTPYAAHNGDSFVKTASLNKGLLADPIDDKGSIIYGVKELYYVHSIESKTQIAFFYTADRLDGLGVLDFRGDRDPSVKQKCLKEIRLFSKADLSHPIKVVKFDYSYELCPGTPNSVGNSSTNVADVIGNNNGKLTLKKVWFEYGKGTKGRFHPYVFEYNKLNSADQVAKYASLGTDRWGVYKLNTANPVGSNFNNDEYPYADQNLGSANTNAGLFHLSKITLPTGGNISVVYEADDYAYVQNKKATAMVTVSSFNGVDGKLKGATGLTIPLDEPLPATISSTNYLLVLAWFKRTYLNNSEYLYTKSYIRVSTPNASAYGNDFDFVSAYCKVTRVEVNGNTALVKFEPVTEGGVVQNPILFAARQKIKNEYPRYAYPGYENGIKADNASKALAAAVGAIANAAKNLSELKENFYQKANRSGNDYATNVDVQKSFVRLVKNSGHKLGGGLRVKRISIADNWDEFDTGTTAPKGIYGQSYEYTKLEGGKFISSGVASYEPSVGNDENAMKQPVPYIQRIKGAINNFFELEEPFGESFFPSPSIIYSKVTVKDLEKVGNDYSANPKTGSIVNEFYTARDFPVRVSILPIQKYNPKPESTYSLVKTNSIEEMVLSQGYSIELNDMHGKPKATRVLNQIGAEISSSISYYKVDNLKAEALKLNNAVSVINEKGVVTSNQVIGRDIEIFTDFREQEFKNTGRALNIGGDLIPLFLGIPFPLPHFPVASNNEYKLFRSACAVKVIQNFGILERVVKTENGSSIAVENMVYDSLTGDAVVTKTQNEFGGNYYSVNLPAYWVYKGMGPAYQTLGTTFLSLSTQTTGIVNNFVYANLLKGGDELVDVSNGNLYWVIEGASGKQLIDRFGEVKKVNLLFAKIVRSGYRNQLQAQTSTLVCINNPIQGNVFRLSANGDVKDLKVINASASLFDEKWATETFRSNAGSQTIVEHNDIDWHMREGSGVPSTGVVACVDTEANQATNNLIHHLYCNIPGSFFNSPGRLKTSNIYPVVTNFVGAYVFTMSFTVPQSKTYYVGAGRNSGSMSYIFDCTDDGITYVSPLNQWTITPIFLTAGTHKVTIGLTGTSAAENAIGLEVYNNTLEQIKNAGDGSDINVIFSTAQLRGNIPLQTSAQIPVSPMVHSSGGPVTNSQPNLLILNHFTYANGTPVGACDVVEVSTDNRVNPYLRGYLGNWRPYQTKVYQDQRSYGYIFKEGTKGINAKDAGYYVSFKPWWRISGNQWYTNGEIEWTTANTITLYDKYGQELENKDALGRYSAANFDFNGEVPAAVASNAMNREIYTNSFEDEKFKHINGIDTLKTRLKSNNGYPIADSTIKTQSHTGLYSYILNTNGITLKTVTHQNEHKTTSYFYLANNASQYMASTIYANGFQPVPGKEYIFNVWVKDNHANNRDVNLIANTKTNGGSASPITLNCKAIVEGWKLLEGKFTAPTANTFEIVVKTNSGTFFIDDLRIHPKDAHLKSYAYNEKDFKLMAELDENAFATFYEYDTEGSLVRVKKETERGIMTLKESRSSYRKNPTVLP